MHFPLKLPLLAMMAFAAAALAASSASAQGVEVTHTEPLTGVPAHCPDVTLHANLQAAEGGCHFVATGEGSGNHPHTFELTVHVFGATFHSFDCHNSFEMRLNENGEGYIQDFVITAGSEGDVSCGDTLVRVCNTGVEAHGTSDGPWHVDTVERADPDPPDNPEVFVATVEVCIVSEDTGRCEGPVAVEVSEDAVNPEDYEAEVTSTHAGQPNGIPCDLGTAEFAGHYDLEPENPGIEDIHINHVN